MTAGQSHPRCDRQGAYPARAALSARAASSSIRNSGQIHFLLLFQGNSSDRRIEIGQLGDLKSQGSGCTRSLFGPDERGTTDERGSTSILVGGDRLAACQREYRTKRDEIDGILDEPDRAVAEERVDTAGVI